jgi:hypothetical protein
VILPLHKRGTNYSRLLEPNTVIALPDPGEDVLTTLTLDSHNKMYDCSLFEWITPVILLPRIPGNGLPIGAKGPLRIGFIVDNVQLQLDCAEEPGSEPGSGSDKFINNVNGNLYADLISPDATLGQFSHVWLVGRGRFWFIESGGAGWSFDGTP